MDLKTFTRKIQQARQLLDDAAEEALMRGPGGDFEANTSLVDDVPAAGDTVEAIQGLLKTLDRHLQHLVRGGRSAAAPSFKVNQPSDRGLLPQRLKREITLDFIKAGLDGNGRFEKPDKGYSRAVDILQKHGIELDQVVNSWEFKQDSRQLTINVAFTNKADLFSPGPINNSMLVLSYHRLSDTAFEVIAYMS